MQKKIPAKSKGECNYFGPNACIIHLGNYRPVNGSVESMSEEESVEKVEHKKRATAVNKRTDEWCRDEYGRETVRMCGET